MSEQEIQELLNTVQKLTASVKELTEENARLRKKLDRMNELLLLAQQTRFGQSSEKREYVLKGGEQMRLFNEAEQLQDPKAAEYDPSYGESRIAHIPQADPSHRSRGQRIFL